MKIKKYAYRKKSLPNTRSKNKSKSEKIQLNGCTSITVVWLLRFLKKKTDLFIFTPKPIMDYKINFF